MSSLENFLLVRHGESAGNFAHYNANEKGNIDYFTKEFRDQPGHAWELTETGIEQARLAGEWIVKNCLSGRFDEYYTSPLTRAMQTAGHMGLPDALWTPDIKLRERYWGDIESMPHGEYLDLHPENAIKRNGDYLNWKPPGGESMAEKIVAVEDFYKDISVGNDGQSVIAACHGETMTAHRSVVEQVRTGRGLASLKMRKHEKLDNTSIIWYTSVDPDSRLNTTHLNWYRIVNPWNDTDTGWKRIERKKYSNEELIDLAKTAKR